MDYLAILKERYKDNNTKIVPRDDHDLFVIINPHWNQNIEIEVFSDGSGDEFIFNFYCHHEHFVNIDRLIEYINWFLNGVFIAYKIFRDEKEIARGFSKMDSIDISTGASIIESFIDGKSYWEQFGAWGLETYDTLYKDYVGGGGSFTFSIYGWNNRHSRDINFVL